QAACFDKFMSIVVLQPAEGTVFPYTTLFRSGGSGRTVGDHECGGPRYDGAYLAARRQPRPRPGAAGNPRVSGSTVLIVDDENGRSGEQTSELQSRGQQVCRPLDVRINGRVDQ